MHMLCRYNLKVKCWFVTPKIRVQFTLSTFFIKREYSLIGKILACRAFVMSSILITLI